MVQLESHLHPYDCHRSMCVCTVYYACVVQLDKAYDPDAPEDDMVERYEEMNRMREHVMQEIDKDHDRLISLDEFLDSTRQSDFKKDEGWDVCSLC